MIGICMMIRRSLRKNGLAKRDFYKEIKDAVENGKSDAEIKSLFMLALEDAAERNTVVNLKNYVWELLRVKERESLIEVLAI